MAMGIWGRWGIRAAMALCAAAGVWLLVMALRDGSDAADPVASVLGSVVGLAALVVSLRPVPEPRTAVVRPVPPEIPEWWVDRNEAAAVIKALRRRTRWWRGSGPVGITAGLHGAGGFGKTTLARYVAAQGTVQRRFPGGVHLITIGRDVRGRAAVAAKVAEETRLITGDASSETGSDPERAGSLLGSLLAQRPRTLLIIDDVWEREQLAPFLQGAEEKCVRLVTTRKPDVLPRTATAIEVDRMTRRQARLLLTRQLPSLPSGDIVEKLVKATGRWALLLGIANKFIADQVATGADPTRAAEALLQRLRAGGPAVQDPDGALDLNDPRQRNTAVRASIQAATTLLQPDNAEARFRELGIFAEDEIVPVDLVAVLWSATGNLDETAVRSLCRQMAGLSLLTINTTLPGGAVTLHDVVRDYQRSELGHTGIVAANTALLDATAATLPSAEGDGVAWWETTSGYLQDHLIEHFLDAGRPAQALQVAGDFRWVRARLHQRGPTAPWHDLDRVGAPARPLARQLASAAHLLTPTHPPHALDAILRSRVIDAPHWPTEPLPAEPAALIDRWPPPDLPDTALLRRLTDHTDGIDRWPSPGLPRTALLRQLTGHTDTAVVGRNGTWMATASRRTGSVQIWNPATGRLRHTLTGHTHPVTTMVSSPGDTWLATASYDGTVRIWNPITGRPLHCFTNHTDLAAEQISMIADPNGVWLAATSDYGVVRIWDASNGRVLRTVSTGGGHPPTAMIVGPDGTWLAIAAHNQIVRVWDVTTGRRRHTLTGHAGRVLAMAVSPNGAWLAIASSDDTMRIWDPTTGHVLRVITTGSLLGLVASPDSTWLATISDDETIRIWDAATGEELRSLANRGHGTDAIVVSPDGTWLATAGYTGTVRIWDVRTGRALRALTASRTHGVTAMIVSPDGTWFATISHNGAVLIWDPNTREARQTSSLHASGVTEVAVSADGASLITASDDGAVRIWDPIAGRVLRTFTADSTPVLRATTRVVSPDGTWLATISSDETIQIWDFATGIVRPLTGHVGTVTSTAASPDGTWLAAGSEDGTVRIWDAATGNVLHTLVEHAFAVTSIAVSPDGTCLASGDSETIHIWDTATGNLLHTITSDSFPWRGRTAVSPDGSWFATAGGRASLRIWDPNTGEAVRTLAGTTGEVTAIAVSPDGSRLATTSNDGTVRVWDSMTGRALAMMRTDSALLSCAWTPDGQGLIAGGIAGLFAYRLHLHHHA
ncbi:NB-ARC domain-containing protein [Streptomyces chartreusis]|uniref:NB-ARC domain-containing protein n=1 Tax=Streptomyces chartreusis TaxID=1969 RepID=UPI003D8B4AC5